MKVKAIYGGFVAHEGIPVLLSEGEEYDAEHPLVAARPELFTAPPKSEQKPEPTPEPKRPTRPVGTRAKSKGADD